MPMRNPEDDVFLARKFLHPEKFSILMLTNVMFVHVLFLGWIMGRIVHIWEPQFPWCRYRGRSLMGMS